MNNATGYECGFEKIDPQQSCEAESQDLPEFAINDENRIKACEFCIKAIVSFKDVEIAKQTKAANIDFDTGLPNRRYLDQELQECIAAGKDVALLQADLEGLKGVNDKLGQSEGDRSIRAIRPSFKGRKGRDITATLRDPDTEDNDSFTSRTGGDEFAVLLVIDDPVEENTEPVLGRENLRKNPESQTLSRYDRAYGAGKRLAKEYINNPDVIDINHKLKKKQRWTLPWRRKELGVRIGIALIEPGDDTDSLLERSSPKPTADISSKDL